MEQACKWPHIPYKIALYFVARPIFPYISSNLPYTALIDFNMYNTFCVYGNRGDGVRMGVTSSARGQHFE